MGEERREILTIATLVNRLFELGGSLRLDGEDIQATWPRNNPEADAIVERLKQHKEDLKSHLRAGSSRAPEPVPTECYACKGKLFWRSIYGVVICWRCHPPGTDRLVVDLLWDGEVKYHQ
jgi:hypothetical protein